MNIINDFKGFTKYEKTFFTLFILAQIIIFFLPLFIGEEKSIGVDGWLNLIAAISGVLCVFMAAKGRLSTFFYGLIQVSTYGYLSFKAHFMGEVGMQVIFGVFQFIGLYVWLKNRHLDQSEKTEEVDSRGLTMKQWGIVIVVTIVVYAALVFLLSQLSGAFYSEQPWIDGASTSLSLVAQTLMTLRFSEQWFFWIVVNIITIVLWVTNLVQSIQMEAVNFGSVAMIVMWVAFLINSIYGYIQWKQKEDIHPL